MPLISMLRAGRSTAFALSMAAVCLSIGTPVLAQPATRPAAADGPRVVRPVEELRQILADLDLSADQQKQVDEIMNATHQMMAGKMREAQGLDRQQRLILLMDAMGEVQTKIKGVLTEEQRPRFETKITEMRMRLRRGPALAGASTRPATRPAPDADGVALLPRFERALEAVDLTDKQRPQVRAILDEGARQIAATRQETMEDDDTVSVRRKIQTLRQEVRDKLGAVLTAEQLEKFESALQADRPGQAGRRNRGADAAPPPGAKTGTRVDETGSALVGRTLPAFSLVKLDGRTVTDRALHGKPSVIIFGSYSSPSFRDRLPRLEELAASYGAKANWLVVYTAEQFPADVEQPERNVADKISIAAHKSFEDRTAAARTARDALKMKLDVAPDPFDIALATRLAGSVNGAVVVNKDGTVLAQQQWADPFLIKRAVDAALADRVEE